MIEENYFAGCWYGFNSLAPQEAFLAGYQQICLKATMNKTMDSNCQVSCTVIEG